ncbi:MAG: class I SAM-dependent methyltransferase [Cyanobacteriota bacterium]|nr:class I SAM-dependent methyltransferase [Cyanobacteriota bacterium]
MSLIETIIKCPVCNNKITGTELKGCSCCEQLNHKIDKPEEGSYTFIDCHPNLSQDKPEGLITQLFNNSVFPWFYENILPTIWKMGLRGFGGIERESQEVLEFFGQDLQVVMDLSCGTGIMTRNLISSKFYKFVIALDYSESMLGMLKKQLDIENTSNYDNLFIIRGNAESIPLIDNSLNAVYAGAAMHCWENPRKAIKEIYRVLKQEGKFFATTFTNFFPSLNKLTFLSLAELREIFGEVGFKQESLEIKSEGVYVTIKCVK